MEQRSKKTLIIYSLLFFLVLCSTVISIVAILKAFEVSRSKCPKKAEDGSEYSYKTATGKGPSDWGSIDKIWSKCNEGLKQSPIDLSYDKAELNRTLGELKQSYNLASATMVNRGHDIMIKFTESAGWIDINDKRYFLKQLHWHSPSEHHINGTAFVLEMHMVHLSSDKKIAVVGTLYTVGQADPSIEMFKEHIRNISKLDHGHGVLEMGKVNPGELKSNGSDYYRYIGSLTTPPCTEGVVWTILRKARTVSPEQVTLLRHAVHADSISNARPIQATYHREVMRYGPA